MSLEKLDVIKNSLKSFGYELENEYDGFIVKELKASNTLDKDRTSKQTHIAITGAQMDFFPSIRANGYFDASYQTQDDGLKKYFVLEVPVIMHKKNIEYLGGTAEQDKEKVFVSIVRSKRNDATDQIQMSMTYLDSPNFIKFRRLCHEGSFLIVLKQKERLLYDVFAIKKEDVSESLRELNNKFIKDSTNTRVYLENIIVPDNSAPSSNIVGFNKIYYGIPGCGKSYKVDAMLKYKDGFKEEAERNGITSKVEEDNIIRTTFYLDYSNSDFVGQIYPVVGDDDKVTYDSIPGPFTKALIRAYTHPNEMVYLIIEEINRGNAAAIFGDLFQLLDRVKETKDGKIKGESEYPISNEFIEGYLDKIIKEKIEVDGDKNRLPMLRNHNIIIPNNLTIFATMNTSDQNVFPLDTAFKRRWDLERVKVDWSKQDGKYKLPILNKCIPFTDMTWGNFASNINVKMVENCKDGIITQDKNLGPFFVDEDLLVEPKDRYNPENKQKIIQFTNNVIDYLFLDVTKFNHDVLFEKGITYSDVYDYFTELLPNSAKGSEEAKRYLKIFDSNIEDDIIEDEPVEKASLEPGENADGDPQ